MSDVNLGNSGTGTRSDNLENIALVADTNLKIYGRSGGGGFSRMLIVPEYYFNAGRNLTTRDDKHTIYRRLESISASVPELILVAGTIAYKKGLFFKDTYNVCPILLNGQIIKKLYKADDDGVYQANGTFRTKNDNGKGVPLVNIGGISIGLDICLDYNNARLGNYLQNNALAGPDIQIQISGTNTTAATNNVARVGGVYIHCDLGGKGTRGATAWRVTAQNGLAGATTTQINPLQTQQPGTGRVMYFNTSV
jgi:predicted amidohydrolase